MPHNSLAAACFEVGGMDTAQQLERIDEAVCLQLQGGSSVDPSDAPRLHSTVVLLRGMLQVAHHHSAAQDQMLFERDQQLDQLQQAMAEQATAIIQATAISQANEQVDEQIDQAARATAAQMATETEALRNELPALRDTVALMATEIETKDSQLQELQTMLTSAEEHELRVREELSKYDSAKQLAQAQSELAEARAGLVQSEQIAREASFEQLQFQNKHLQLQSEEMNQEIALAAVEKNRTVLKLNECVAELDACKAGHMQRKQQLEQLKVDHAQQMTASAQRCTQTEEAVVLLQRQLAELSEAAANAQRLHQGQLNDWGKRCDDSERARKVAEGRLQQALACDDHAHMPAVDAKMAWAKVSN